jgi:uncharacterized protein
MTGPSPSGSYPQRVGIDAYGNGGFRFADMSHKGGLLCLPNGMHAWTVSAASELTLAALQPVLDHADEIEVLLIGLGEKVAALDPAIRTAMRERGIIVEATQPCAPIMCFSLKTVRSRVPSSLLRTPDEFGFI